MLLKRCKSIACKALCITLSMVLVCVPFLGISVSAEKSELPTTPFNAQYYDLESGSTVTTPEFPALPQYITTQNGLVYFQDYIIVKGRDVYGNVAYYVHLFSEECNPSSIDIQYSFDKMPAKMAAMRDIVAESEFWKKQNNAFADWIHDMIMSGSLAGNAVYEFLVLLGLNKTIGDNSANLSVNNSETWWKNYVLSNSDRIGSFYKEMCADGSCHPWLDITLTYNNKIQSYIAFYTAGSSSWNWINSYSPSGAHTYNIVGAESTVASSFGSSVIISKSQFVSDVLDDVKDTPIKRPVDKAPSWNNGNGSGGDSSSDTPEIGDSFVSGSWYNDGNTGNPFVAAFAAPWIGINWTYENVASEISLFGVSIADMITTFIVIIVAAFFINWLRSGASA